MHVLPLAAALKDMMTRIRNTLYMVAAPALLLEKKRLSELRNHSTSADKGHEFKEDLIDRWHHVRLTAQHARQAEGIATQVWFSNPEKHHTGFPVGAKQKDGSGAALVEAAGALALLFPLVVLITYAVIEVSYAYVISSSLSAAAHQAARNLVIAYWKNSDIATSRGLQDTEVFDQIRIQNILNDSRQFEQASFQTDSNPPSVSVRVRYLGGQYGLPPFPNPDPLKLGNFDITATASQALD